MSTSDQITLLKAACLEVMVSKNAFKNDKMSAILLQFMK